jgi:hypothetical protein
VQVRLSVADLLQGPSIAELTASILSQLDLGAGASASAPEATTWEEGTL